MIETILSTLGSLGPWWPAIAKIVTIWTLGQVFKKRVWTKQRAAHSVFVAFMRASLPLHPFVVGALWGLGWPDMPACDFVSSRGAAVNEGLVCAFITVAGHTVLEYVALHFVLRNPDSKWGIVLKVLREAVRERETSIPPPSPKIAQKLLDVKVTPQEALMSIHPAAPAVVSLPPTVLEEIEEEPPVRILPRVPPPRGKP